MTFCLILEFTSLMDNSIQLVHDELEITEIIFSILPIRSGIAGDCSFETAPACKSFIGVYVLSLSFSCLLAHPFLVFYEFAHCPNNACAFLKIICSMYIFPYVLTVVFLLDLSSTSLLLLAATSFLVLLRCYVGGRMVYEYYLTHCILHSHLLLIYSRNYPRGERGLSCGCSHSPNPCQGAVFPREYRKFIWEEQDDRLSYFRHDTCLRLTCGIYTANIDTAQTETEW
jgi:hypothetical protein